jgi:anti-sigma factor RsiW
VTLVPSIDEAVLHAYVDNLLEPEQARVVEAWLAREPELARRIQAQRNQREMLRNALAPIAAESIPTRLDITRLAGRRRIALRSWQWLAAAAALFVLGGVGGYGLRGARPGPLVGISALAREAADSFRVHAVDPTHPVELDASDKAELVRWFSERLQSEVTVPDLFAAGYRLLGGRLVVTPHGPAALFVYTNSASIKLAVLVRPMTVEKNMHMSEHADGAIGTIAWSERGIGYSLVGASTPASLRPLADEVQQQLRLRSGG